MNPLRYAFPLSRITRQRRVITLAAIALICWTVPRAAPVNAQETRTPRGAQPQDPAPAASSPRTYTGPTQPTIVMSSDEDYHIGATDVIEVRVEDAPELSRTYRVAANGTFPMPFLGKITALGKTPDEIGKLIADGLRGQYLVDPKVSVAVLQYNSRSFFIQGAVHLPGIYQIEGRPSLWRLITVAGGLADNHGSTAFIVREIKQRGSNSPAAEGAGGMSSGAAGPSNQQTDQPGSPRTIAGSDTSPPNKDDKDAPDPDPDFEILKANISGFDRGNLNNTHPVVIQPGDVINIPVIDVFFVAGEVRAPGQFFLKEGTTLRQAISLAQGTTFKAIASKGLIFREDAKTGKRTEINVDITQVMSGKKEDVPILANDIIVVPHSGFKAGASVILNAFGANAARVPVF